MRAVARTEGLLLRAIGGEVLVYDTRSHRAHCLNSTAALVFRHADGSRTIRDLAACLSGDAEAAEAMARAAVSLLIEAGLLEGDSVPSPPESCSRREALRSAGLGAALLAPAAISLLVPTPAEAAATCIPAASCTPANAGQPCHGVSLLDCDTKTCDDLGNCV